MTFEKKKAIRVHDILIFAYSIQIVCQFQDAWKQHEFLLVMYGCIALLGNLFSGSLALF